MAWAAAACLAIAAFSSPALPADWPQWCGSDGKNMVSGEKGLPDSFVPGDKDGQKGEARAGTTKNVKWARHLCQAIYSTPVIAGGKIFVGGRQEDEGVLLCLDEQTGKPLWKWHGPAKEVPHRINGWLIGISVNPAQLGVCSSPVVDQNRVYFVSHDFKVICLDAGGKSAGVSSDSGEAKVVWAFDMWDRLGVFPCDAANGSPVIDGDLLYVQTSNGVDRNMDPNKEKNRKVPAPNAPNVIVLDKRTGRLVATDAAPILSRLMHGQWSSVSLGTVGGKRLLFFGGGDGLCYAFETLGTPPEKPGHLKTVWSYDCVPPEYKAAAGSLDWISYYCMGDRRHRNGPNKNDGKYTGMSEIVGTPVFYKNRIYVAIGRDPEHGRGRGALHCIDATKTGDITQTGRIWTYQGLDRTLSTVSIDGGLVYISDVAGRLHCLDVETGQCYWMHETNAPTWSSTLVADGRVYMPTSKGLWVLATGRKKEILSQVSVGGAIYASPVVANGTLYVTSTHGWMWAVCNQKP
jgi:outer membrane protein assembly factor BamB